MRAKVKKNLREAALRSETPTVVNSDDSQEISKEAQLSSSSESASGSVTDSSNAGIEADTEDNATSEDESEQSGNASPDDGESGEQAATGKKEKWVAVKGKQAAVDA